MKTRFLLMVGVSVLLAGVVNAQETPAPNQGGYDIFGTLSVGYRMINVSGSEGEDGDWFDMNAENLFREQYGLTSSGGALGNKVPLRLDIYGSKVGVFDQFNVNADFNPTVQGGALRLRRMGAYDLNVSYKNVNYFFDRYDSLFYDLRQYKTNRQDLDATLDFTATENIGFSVGYRGIGHGGTIMLPRTMFVEAGTEGPGNIYGSYARGNYFLMELPRTDFNSEFSAAVNADFDMFAISLGGGFMDYTEKLDINPVATSRGLSLNYRDTNVAGIVNDFGIVGDNAAFEPLLGYEHAEDRELSGPFFFAQATLTPAEIFSLTANFRMESLEGTTTVDINQLGQIRRSRYNLLLRGLYEGEVTSTLDRMLFSAAATVTPIPELDVTAGVKISNHDLEAEAAYHVRMDTASLSATRFISSIDSTGNPAHFEWKATNKQPIMTIFGGLNFAPITDLTVNAGVSIGTRSPEVNRTEDGAADSVIANNMSKEVASMGINAGLGYRIMPGLNIRGRFEMLTREATFSDQTFAPAAQPSGTVTDLEPRNAPEEVTRIGASLNWAVMPGFDAGLRFNMSNAKSDLTEGMWVTADKGNPVEYKNDDMTISAVFSYAIDENTSIRLLGENRSRELSIPVTFTRGQMLPEPLFGLDPNAPPVGSGQVKLDSGTAILSEETNDMYIDFGVGSRFAEVMTAGLGVSYLGVTGNPTMSPAVRGPAYANTPTRQGDVTRVGGPFSRITFNGNVGYDITTQFSVLLDVFYAMQNEEEVDLNLPGTSDPADPKPAEVRFYGLNDYNGLSAALNVVYNF